MRSGSGVTTKGVGQVLRTSVDIEQSGLARRKS